MASNENFQAHYQHTPPSPTLKTHPTRRRVIRKSPRTSIKLTTLKKASTIPAGNDSNHYKTDPLRHPPPTNFTFDPYDPVPLKKTSIDAPGSDGPGYLGGGSGTLLRLFSCLGCGFPLRQPVTLECGHTCCKECGIRFCPECGCAVEKEACVNVLVRCIVNKLIGEDLQERGNNREILINLNFKVFL